MNFSAVKMESTELPHDLETQDVFDSDKELIDLYVKFNYEDPNTQKQEKRNNIHSFIMDSQNYVLKINGTIYQRWCRLQSMLGLRDDTAVAVFLIECYENSLSKKNPALQCSYCRRPLSCSSCAQSLQYNSSTDNAFLQQEHILPQHYQHQGISPFSWGSGLESTEKKLYFGSQVSEKGDLTTNINQACSADVESTMQAVHSQQSEMTPKTVSTQRQEEKELIVVEKGNHTEILHEKMVKEESACVNGNTQNANQNSLEHCEESCQSSGMKEMAEINESKLGSTSLVNSGLKSKATRAMENFLANSSRIGFHRQLDGLSSLPLEKCGGKMAMQASKTFECRVCWKVFFNSSEHHIHMRTHTGEKRICKECGATFDSTGHLTRHMRKHSGLRPFICQECFATFADSSTLKKHMLTHATNKIFKCEICLIGFSRSDSLKVHMRAHTGEKPFVCRTCDATFSTSSHLKLHMRKHSGAKPFLCQMCGKAFADSSSMRRHTVNQACSKTLQC